MTRPLKKRPFCGGNKVHVHFSGIGGAETPDDSYNVTCRYPDCHGEIFALGCHKFKTREEAIEAWNTRAAHDIADRVAMLEANAKLLAFAYQGITPDSNTQTPAEYLETEQRIREAVNRVLQHPHTSDTNAVVAKAVAQLEAGDYEMIADEDGDTNETGEV